MVLTSGPSLTLFPFLITPLLFISEQTTMSSKGRRETHTVILRSDFCRSRGCAQTLPCSSLHASQKGAVWAL